VGHDTVRAEWSSFTEVVNIISRPCGPHKLARILQKCFNQGSSTSPPEPMVSLEPEPKPPSVPVENTSSIEQIIPSDDNKFSNTDNIPPNPHDTSIPSPTRKIESLPPPSITDNAKASPEPRKPRVLVVEDNKINLNLMLAFLKKRNLMTLDSAENGQLAVNAVQALEHRYDIIFMGKASVSFPVRPNTKQQNQISLCQSWTVLTPPELSVP